MTTESAPARRPESRSQPHSGILDLCDQVLGEVGRRRHLFAWLRPPGAGGGDWLPVDAYYPANRLVVICREQSAEHDRLYAELVPTHGLRLLTLTSSELSGDVASIEPQLRAKLAELGAVPAPNWRSSDEPRPPGSASERAPKRSAPAPLAFVARWAGSTLEGTSPRPVNAPARQALAMSPLPKRIGPSRADAARRAARFAHARTADIPRPAPATLPRARSTSQGSGSARPRAEQARPRATSARAPATVAGDAETLGLFAGLALVAILAVEIYVDVMRLAIDAGQLVLAFGIALDACSRALGTIAAGHCGRRDWAWACALGGSPAVVALASSASERRVPTEPWPLATLLAVLALLVTTPALLAIVLG